MSLVGFKAQNHTQQVVKNGARDDVDDRGTKREFIDELEERFGRFTLDVAAAPHNAKADTYYTRESNGLASPWRGNVWCNPPYSDLRSWVRKAWLEWSGGTANPNRDHWMYAINGAGTPDRIVMLVPSNRPEQKWWQEWVEPFRDRSDSPLRVEFLPGRMRFDRPGVEIGPKGDRPPFGCCLLIWEAS